MLPPRTEADKGIVEVLQRLDEPAPGPRSLYYRWETEQWEAGALAFAHDRASWEALEDDQRRSILAGLACFLVPDGRVSDLLVPFVDAVPSEEEQVFLTSQLVDEARAVVFSDRLRTEIFEQGEDTSAWLRPNQHLGRLLDLAEPRADEVRVQREAGPSLHEGLLILGVIVNGVIAPTLLRRLGRWLEDEGGWPGITEGLRGLGQDTSRHAHFAVRLLQEALADDARDENPSAPGIEALIEEALPILRGVVDEAAEASNDFSGLPFGDDELSAETMDCLALRMQDIGIDLPA